MANAGSTGWMLSSKWDALVRGEGCPLCTEVKSEEAANRWGYTVLALRFSRLRLQANQYIKGYCILISNKHVREPFELSKPDQVAFFQDMLQAGQAIEEAFGAIKMNYEILGNSCPHLHCHIIPRVYGDPAPGRPMHPDEHVRLLTPAEYENRVERIRAALALL